MGDTGNVLQLVGARHLEDNYARVAEFTHQFAPIKYSKHTDPAVQEFVQLEARRPDVRARSECLSISSPVMLNCGLGEYDLTSLKSIGPIFLRTL